MGQQSTGPVPVTFIVTGYNQLHLIGEAIDGALSQDYPRLQVILADDCSHDGTYERMQGAADAYAGPHEVLVNRPDRNRGTLGNIYDAFRRATGELIVLAGGDDISYPHRTQVLVDHWRQSGADALYSKYDVIDEAGQLIERDYKPKTDGMWIRDYFPNQDIEPLHGASAACHRSVFEKYPAPAERIRSEDAFFTLMLSLDRRTIEYVDQALVRYRKHAGAITNEVPTSADRSAIEERERVQMAFARSQTELLELFSSKVEQRGAGAGVRKALADDIKLFRLRGRWDESSIVERLAALPAARRRRQLTWLLPRIPGLGAFATAKRAALARRSEGSS
jgi:glycosyltransferase involved in cell wall biosynthesis